MTPRRSHGLLKLRMSSSARASFLEMPSQLCSALCSCCPRPCSRTRATASFAVRSSPLRSLHTWNNSSLRAGALLALTFLRPVARPFRLSTAPLQLDPKPREGSVYTLSLLFLTDLNIIQSTNRYSKVSPPFLLLF